jgi:hypothetical protein
VHAKRCFAVLSFTKLSYARSAVLSQASATMQQFNTTAVWGQLIRLSLLVLLFYGIAVVAWLLIYVRFLVLSLVLL